ncbi:hypothetical protein Ahy_B10g102678 [Arachis hypogaea]|uniref:Retrotransposon gag domain-containing protein n=1 Tax=Arachis hypogaea TaxID=3818 RepID=A0A444X2B6_ARAHY|nr:hypothetical protein Ahy_B10g102678 [Arachis hypogaea]
MRLRSGKIIHMADEMSNVNGGSSTNDSIPPPLTVGWPPYGLPPGYTPPVGGFVLPIHFGNTSGGSNSQNPQQHSEYSRNYNVGSTSNAANSMTVYRQQVEESHHDLVNLLTQQMTTILNPMIADHESKFERLAGQVERIARIVDYDEGEGHNAKGNNEGFRNEFQNENNNARSRCYVSLPENEVVKIATMGLGFYMRRKLLNVHIPDLAHLAKKVHQTELMKKEKEKYRSEQRSKSKPFTQKEKVAYVTMESSEEEIDFETEVDLAEFKKGPPAGDGLLDFLVQQKIKDRDVSLCPWCNAVFDAEAAAIFEKERIKKELTHREEQARQRQPIWRIEGQCSKTPQQSSAAPLSRSQAIGRVSERQRRQENSNQHKKPQVEVSKEATPFVHSRIVFPSDGETCPKGIPSPVKMEKGKAIPQTSGIDKNKEVDVDEEYFDEGDDDMIRTISIIPTEYLGEYEGDPDEDYDVENEEAFSFIRIEDEPGYFLRPTEKHMSHLCPLHITTTLSGIKVDKVLIDGGAIISLLPERMLIKVEGLSVKLRYPELGFEPTGWNC